MLTAAFHDSDDLEGLHYLSHPPLAEEAQIIQKVKDWLKAGRGCKWILWLSGCNPQSCNITRRITTIFESQHTLLGTFFYRAEFASQDPERALVATLAYQLSVNVPLSRQRILEVIQTDPLIFARGLHVQLRRLILEPLQTALRARTNSNSFCGIFILDGLDRFPESLSNIVHAIITTCRCPDKDVESLPIRFIITTETRRSSAVAVALNLYNNAVEHLPMSDSEHRSASTTHNLGKTIALKTYSVCPVPISKGTYPCYQDSLIVLNLYSIPPSRRDRS